MTAWATLAQARTHWPDSGTILDPQLGELLDVATETVAAYAPAAQWRTLTDAATTTGQPTLTSALGAFTAADKGRLVVGAGIPAGATILSVAAPVAPATTSTTATMSTNATATASALEVLVLPKPFMLACVYQARETWAASRRDSGDVIGVGDYAIRARPLTAQVKALLRPLRAVPVVG